MRRDTEYELRIKYIVSRSSGDEHGYRATRLLLERWHKASRDLDIFSIGSVEGSNWPIVRCDYETMFTYLTDYVVIISAYWQSIDLDVPIPLRGINKPHTQIS